MSARWPRARAGPARLPHVEEGRALRRKLNIDSTYLSLLEWQGDAPT